MRMTAPMIYLDNAATSWPKRACVSEAMIDFLAHRAGNPGRGGHAMARAANTTIEDARKRISELINSPTPSRVVLTHGCTDALNLAIHGVISAAKRAGCDGSFRVVASVLEHNAVLRSLHCYSVAGEIDFVQVGCSSTGVIDLDELRSLCTECTALVCLTHASNAMGTIQPIADAIGVVREAAPDALTLVDCAQTLGHFPVDVQAMGADFVSIAGHKGLGGPTGTGALFVGSRAYPDCCEQEKPRVFCLRRGGTGSIAPGLEMPEHLPDALEAGTPNAVGFAGLLAAIDAMDPADHAHEMALTERILQGLKSINGIKVSGIPGIEGRTAVVLFNIDGVGSRSVADRLDKEYNIAVRAGSHCAPLAHYSIGNGEDGGVRVSPGRATTIDEIDRFLDAVRTIANNQDF